MAWNDIEAMLLANSDRLREGVFPITDFIKYLRNIKDEEVARESWNIIKASYPTAFTVGNVRLVDLHISNLKVIFNSSGHNQ